MPQDDTPIRCGCQREKKPLLYSVGVSLALIAGGFIGYGVFLGCATWYYGGNPIESIVQAHSSTGTDVRLPLYLFVIFKTVCITVAGLLMLTLYQRTLGRTILDRKA